VANSPTEKFIQHSIYIHKGQGHINRAYRVIKVNIPRGHLFYTIAQVTVLVDVPPLEICLNLGIGLV